MSDVLDADAAELRGAPSAATYRRFLARTFGYVFPLERSLLDTPPLVACLEPRRLRKHLLLEHDLQAMGMRPPDIATIPQCMSIPWFEDVHGALGWAYALERTTLAHPQLYRHLATVLPGEVAFASSYLKCYFGAIGEMWQSFAACLEAAVQAPRDADRIVETARAALQHRIRWREIVEAPEGPHGREDEPASSSRQLALAFADDA